MNATEHFGNSPSPCRRVLTCTIKINLSKVFFYAWNIILLSLSIPFNLNLINYMFKFNVRNVALLKKRIIQHFIVIGPNNTVWINDYRSKYLMLRWRSCSEWPSALSKSMWKVLQGSASEGEPSSTHIRVWCTAQIPLSSLSETIFPKIPTQGTLSQCAQNEPIYHRLLRRCVSLALTQFFFFI